MCIKLHRTFLRSETMVHLHRQAFDRSSHQASLSCFVPQVMNALKKLFFSKMFSCHKFLKLLSLSLKAKYVQPSSIDRGNLRKFLKLLFSSISQIYYNVNPCKNSHYTCRRLVQPAAIKYILKIHPRLYRPLFFFCPFQCSIVTGNFQKLNQSSFDSRLQERCKEKDWEPLEHILTLFPWRPYPANADVFPAVTNFSFLVENSLLLNVS